MSLTHNKKNWGYEAVVVNTKLYSSRVLIILEGESLSSRYNKKQDKTLFVLQGVVKLVIEGNSKFLNEGDTYHIHPKVVHSITAMQGDATIIEIGTPLQDDEVITEAAR